MAKLGTRLVAFGRGDKGVAKMHLRERRGKEREVDYVDSRYNVHSNVYEEKCGMGMGLCRVPYPLESLFTMESQRMPLERDFHIFQ